MAENTADYPENAQPKVEPLTIGLTAASILASVFGTIYSNRQNRELARDQNAMNIAQWERENAYNTPLNQMARMREAGLNPSLVYNNAIDSRAASSPDLSSSLAPNQAVEVDPNWVLNASSVMAQNRLADSQAQLNQTEADKNKAETDIKDYYYTNILPQEFKNKQQEFDRLCAETQLLINKTYNVSADTYNKRLKSIYLPELDRATVKKLWSEYHLNARELNEMTWTFASRLSQIRSQTGLNFARSKYFSQLAETEKERTELVHWQGNSMYYNAANQYFEWHLNTKFGEAERFLNLSRGIATIGLIEANTAQSKSKKQFYDRLDKFYKHKTLQNWGQLYINYRNMQYNGWNTFGNLIDFQGSIKK